MRIALFHNLLSGGAKRTLQEMVRRLSARHTIDAFSLSGANHDFADIRPWVASHRLYDFQPLPLLDSPFGRLNQAIRLADLGRLQLVARRIARDIDAGGYDLLFAHPCQVANSPPLLRFLERTPSLFYCQEPLRRLYEPMPPRPYDDEQVGRRRLLNRVDPLPALYDGVLRHVDRAGARSAARLLVNSHFIRGMMSEIYGVTSHVSYHAVDGERFAPRGRTRKRFVLSVGSLTPLKGFDFLIESIGRMEATTRPTLAIASNFQNPPERAYLLDLARQRRVHLELHDSVSDERLLELYCEAAVVAYSPIREPFGLVPLEAMACETPVVAVREGGTQESIVDGETGLLVERDPEQFAQALKGLLDYETRARMMGRRGRQHVLSNWSWQESIASLESHLYATVA